MQTKLMNGKCEITRRQDIARGTDWENHLILQINKQHRFEIPVLNQEMLNRVLYVIRENAFFYPDYIFMNADALHDLEKTPIHIVQGARHTAAWSVLDNLKETSFKHYKFGPWHFPMARVTGTRTGAGIEKNVYIVDITRYVSRKDQILEQALKDTVCDLTYFFHAVARGNSSDNTVTLVIKPTVKKHGGDAYAVYCVVTPAAKSDENTLGTIAI